MYSKIKINENEEKVVELLNEYLFKGNKCWYKKDIIVKNLTSRLDNINEQTIIQVSHPKSQGFAEQMRYYDLYKILHNLK